MNTNFDACDTNHIYNNDGYSYSLPRHILASYLDGKAFDKKESYNAEQSKDLRDDVNDIYAFIFAKNPDQKCQAVITAGGPGSGKTWKMRQDIQQEKNIGNNSAYIDPDDVCLKDHMHRTYKKILALCGPSKEARKGAYDEMRPGSNFATHAILANLIRQKIAFHYGTTATGEPTKFFFDHLKKQGYHIRLIHVTAPDDVRWASIQERDKTFVQTTEEDVREKGKLLPQRINDTYMKYADVIQFCYRDNVSNNAELAAVWIRNPANSTKLGQLTILDRVRYDKIKQLHNETAKGLDRSDLDWDSAVDNNSDIQINS